MKMRPQTILSEMSGGGKLWGVEGGGSGGGRKKSKERWEKN